MLSLDINLINENFRKITESTAIGVFPYLGKNNKHAGDEIAVNAMRKELNSLPFGTRVIIGEGEKDDAPYLYEGEVLGKGDVILDLAVDPLECTTNFSKGLPNSMSVLAYSEKDGLAPVPGTYMEQWIAGPEVGTPLNPENTLRHNIEILSDYKRKTFDELLIVVQERPRHEMLIRSLRDLGCGVALIESGSLSAVMDICLEFGHYDAMIGTYGAPEGLISALIAKATESQMKAILRPHEEIYKERWEEAGYLVDQVMDKDDLVTGEFFGLSATCITSNLFLKGLVKKGKKLHGQTLTITPHGHEVHEFVTWE
ncbi:MAG: fructose-bisphosphatase class II [Leptospiraceae bacterium]|nr:fructose-bisphosphatase class II [Leptospiraceae bacterium]MCP5513085.1 fructose-bisphosphatase class II [Leptospiraceae bacterium]